VNDVSRDVSRALLGKIALPVPNLQRDDRVSDEVDLHPARLIVG
jgi:hypothetical protein